MRDFLINVLVNKTIGYFTHCYLDPAGFNITDKSHCTLHQGVVNFEMVACNWKKRVIQAQTLFSQHLQQYLPGCNKMVFGHRGAQNS